MGATGKINEQHASILLDANEANPSAENGSFTGWDTAAEFILAVLVNYYDPCNKSTDAAQLRIDFSEDGGAWTPVAAGQAIAPGSSTTLVNGNSPTQRITTNVPSAYCGSGWSNAGKEVEGTNTSASFSLGSETWTEVYFALDPALANPGSEYTFRLYNATDGVALAYGTIQSSVTIATAAATEAALTISQNLGVSPAGQGDMLAALGISQTMAQGQSGQADTFGAVSISISLGTAQAGSCNLYAGMSLAAVFSQAQSGGLTILADTALSQVMAILAAARHDAEAGLSIEQHMSISALSSAAREGLVSLAKTLAISAQAQAQAYGAISVAHQLSVLLDGSTEGAVEAAVSLVQSWSADLAAQADAQADAQLQSACFFASQGAALAGAAISLSHQLAQSQQGSGIVAAQIAMALQAGVGITAGIAIDAGVVMAQSLGISESAQAEAQASLTVAQAYACVVVGQAIAAAGLNMDSVQSVVLTGSSVSTEITTPDGRMSTVRVDVRIKDVCAENRIHPVGREDRIITVH